MNMEELIPNFDQHKEEILELINSIDDDYKKMDFDTFPEKEDAVLDYMEMNYPSTYNKLQTLTGYFRYECTYSIDALKCAETYVQKKDTDGQDKILTTLAGIRIDIIFSLK